MAYFVRNKVNIGVIGKGSGGNAGFYDQIRIYCMWKAVQHVLTAFHCQWSTISCILSLFMVFFMSYLCASQSRECFFYFSYIFSSFVFLQYFLLCFFVVIFFQFSLCFNQSFQIINICYVRVTDTWGWGCVYCTITLFWFEGNSS